MLDDHRLVNSVERWLLEGLERLRVERAHWQILVNIDDED